MKGCERCNVVHKTHSCYDLSADFPQTLTADLSLGGATTRGDAERWRAPHPIRGLGMKPHCLEPRNDSIRRKRSSDVREAPNERTRRERRTSRWRCNGSSCPLETLNQVGLPWDWPGTVSQSVNQPVTKIDYQPHGQLATVKHRRFEL